MTTTLVVFGAVVGGGKSLVFATKIRTPQRFGLELELGLVLRLWLGWGIVTVFEEYVRITF